MEKPVIDSWNFTEKFGYGTEIRVFWKQKRGGISIIYYKLKTGKVTCDLSSGSATPPHLSAEQLKEIQEDYDRLPTPTTEWGQQSLFD